MKITSKEQQNILSTVVYAVGGVLIAFGIKDWVTVQQFNPILIGVIILIVGAYILNLKK